MHALFSRRFLAFVGALSILIVGLTGVDAPKAQANVFKLVFHGLVKISVGDGALRAFAKSSTLAISTAMVTKT